MFAALPATHPAPDLVRPLVPPLSLADRGHMGTHAFGGRSVPRKTISDRVADPTHCMHWQTAVFVRVAAPADFARCLEEGADVHVRDEHDNTVLHHAASLDAAVTTLLLETGAK